ARLRRAHARTLEDFGPAWAQAFRYSGRYPDASAAGRRQRVLGRIARTHAGPDFVGYFRAIRQTPHAATRLADIVVPSPCCREGSDRELPNPHPRAETEVSSGIKTPELSRDLSRRFIQ